MNDIYKKKFEDAVLSTVDDMIALTYQTGSDITANRDWVTIGPRLFIFCINIIDPSQADSLLRTSLNIQRGATAGQDEGAVIRHNIEQIINRKRTCAARFDEIVDHGVPVDLWDLKVRFGNGITSGASSVADGKKSRKGRSKKVKRKR